MSKYSVQQIFNYSFEDYAATYPVSEIQWKVAKDIMACKTGKLGANLSICPECDYQKVHNNSCRNRNCPCCQAVQKERWVDARKAEVISTPYFHVVFTLPAELRSLIFANQKLLYSLLHECAAKTLLELSSNKKYLGATPGIIQVEHTWGQQLQYHPHVHCIISGGGLTKDEKLLTSREKFFIPVKVLGSKFRGKFLALLEKLYQANKIIFTDSCKALQNTYDWKKFTFSLREKDWIPYIKETFNGFGNAIEYLGRYTHRIAISNARILSVTETETTFKFFNNHTKQMETTTLSNVAFIRRFLQHVLPRRFQKIRYYGFLNNRSKRKNLKILFKLMGKQKFRSRYTNMKMEEFLLKAWNINIRLCPNCGCQGIQIGRMRPQLN